MHEMGRVNKCLDLKICPQNVTVHDLCRNLGIFNGRNGRMGASVDSIQKDDNY